MESTQVARSAYTHTPFQEASNIRLLRLLPSRDNTAPIRCQLFEYPLDDSEDAHLYEALSYVWGSPDNPETIYVQDDNDMSGQRALNITSSLHAALLRLRNRYIERTIWVDAVCINQKDNQEKGQQVQMMAKVYSKAARVIVWLGDASDESDEAMKTLYDAAGSTYAETPIEEPNKSAIIKLLERPWFQRIWILQEVTAARQVVVRCGSMEMDGSAFCAGIDATKPFEEEDKQELQTLLRSITYIIQGAHCRARNENDPAATGGRFSLQIRPLALLISIFRNRKATDHRDKIYALMGMCTDDLGLAGLSADYGSSWKDVSRNMLRYATSDQMHIDTWDGNETAVIRGNACYLGLVSSVFENETTADKVSVGITWESWSIWDRIRNLVRGPNKGAYEVDAPAKPFLPGDVLVLLQGARSPTIARPYNGYLVIIANPVYLMANESYQEIDWASKARDFDFDSGLLLVWNWGTNEGYSEDQDLDCFPKIPGVSNAPLPVMQGLLNRAAVTWNLGLLMEKTKKKGGEDWKDWPEFRMAAEAYRTALGDEDNCASSLSESTYVLWAEDLCKEGHGTTALSLAAINRHEMGVRLILDKFRLRYNIDVKVRLYSIRSPLFWAVKGGNVAVTELLLGPGPDVVATPDVDIDMDIDVGDGVDAGVGKNVVSGYDNGVIDGSNVYGFDNARSLLHIAALNGHFDIVRMLLDRGIAIGASQALRLAAANGDIDIISELLDRGTKFGLNVNGDYGGRSLLGIAAESGQIFAVKLLLDRRASINNCDEYSGKTPLSYAAEKGHADVLHLLLDEGANPEKTGEHERHKTALFFACTNGQLTAAQLLLDRGANIDVKDDRDKTLFYNACIDGKNDLVDFLVANGADINAKPEHEDPVLYSVVNDGHEEIARTLITNGADVNVCDSVGRTPLISAASRGNETITQLLLDHGANIEMPDSFGYTPFAYAAQSGKREVVQLLLDNGANPWVQQP